MPSGTISHPSSNKLKAVTPTLFSGWQSFTFVLRERKIMEGHDNKQVPPGETMEGVNEAFEQDEKRVTLEMDIWYLVFKQV